MFVKEKPGAGFVDGAHSSSGVSHRMDPSESHVAESCSVHAMEVCTSTRPCVLPSGRAEAKGKIDSTSGLRASDMSVGKTSHVGSHPNRLPHSEGNSQVSTTASTIQGLCISKTSRCEGRMPPTKSHVEGIAMKTASNPHRKAASSSTSGESSGVQIITNSRKPSCWARGTGSGPSQPQSINTISERGDDFLQVDRRPSWYQPEPDQEKHLHVHRRADFGKLPRYHFPGGSKKNVDRPQHSFGRQNVYARENFADSSPRLLAKPTLTSALGGNPKGLQETSNVSKFVEPRDAISSADTVMPIEPTAIVAQSRTPVDDGPAAVPPHRRAKLKKPPMEALQSKTSEPQHLLAKAQASLSAQLPSSDRGKADEQRAPAAVETCVESFTSEKNLPPTTRCEASPGPSQSQLDKAAPTSTLTKAPRAKGTNLHIISSAEVEPHKAMLAPHRRGQEPMSLGVVTDADNTPNNCCENTPKLAETRSGIETSALRKEHHPLSGGLKDITNQPPTQSFTPQPSGKQVHSLNGFTGGRARDRTASTRRVKKHEWEDPHYETQLVDYKGDMLPAPIGDEWQVRDKYHNPDERLAVLQEYAEDQAIEIEKAIPTVDTNSPSFLAGHAVLDDERVEEIDLENSKSTATSARPRNGYSAKASKTADDAMKEYVKRLEKSNSSLGPTEAPMTKEQKRELRRALLESERNYVPPPNPYAPKANIYLRPVELNDASQINGIWNHYVRTSAAVPIVHPDEQLFWRNTIIEAHDGKQPFIVAILMGDKATRNQREVRRLKQEHIVGFARAIDFGFPNTAYRYTVELEVYVQDGHGHMGIGKTLFDRIMAATSVGYNLKEGAPFLCADGVDWVGGSYRIVKTILCNLLHHEDDKDLGWKKKWLEQEDFQQAGFVPKIGYKLGKPYQTNNTFSELDELSISSMAPWMELNAEDDFVRTISDEDSSFPVAEEEDLVLPNPAKSTTKSEKRKRDRIEGVNVSSVPTKKKRKGGTKQEHTSQGNESSGAYRAEEENETWTAGGENDGAMNSDFEFQMGNLNDGVTDEFDAWEASIDQAGSSGQKQGDKRGVDIDALIARRRSKVKLANDTDDEGQSEEALSAGRSLIDSAQGDDDEEEDETLAEDAFGMGAPARTGNSDEEYSEDARDSFSESDNEIIADEMPDPEDIDTSAEGASDSEEQAKRDAFFAPEEPAPPSGTLRAARANGFQSFSLSRPILRGIASVGFSNPTPIQRKTVPVALLGKDVVGGAVTGSGKTAAFIVPILERLLYRPKKVPTSRVAILMPTRELALQCFKVARKLAGYTDITFCQLVGGFSLREQETVLRSRPDVIIATPGRFIDHMRNSPSFTVETLEILVLDEADRMLEDGFADELNEILTTIPKSRQTMLFSATMTDSVDKLIRVGLNRPVRLIVDARKQTVGTLVQEFMRLRPGREGMRLGYLLVLCQEVFTDRVVVFFRQKKEAHRVRVIFSLLGIKAAELHGSMSQEQRIAAITSFTSHDATHLLATDLASRGLDIPSILTVINYEAPQSHEIYLHRVGRTARAGREGRSCTLAAESDRKVVKAAVKAGREQGAKIVSRMMENTKVDEMMKRLEGMDEEVEAVLIEEKEEKLLNQEDMRIRKGENIIDHASEIQARPKRTWFESEKEKLKAKRAGHVELNGKVGHAAAKGEKLSNKDKKNLDDRRKRVEGRTWKKGKSHAASRKRR
ncbi:MAG: hypothetical protein Q9163_001179 [Psora crenata]